jgi:ribosomal-protein-alanine N-acetyltransferase
MMNGITLETERLILKSITPALIRHLFETLDKEQIMRFLGESEAGYEKHLQMNKEGLEMYRISLYYFLLVKKESHLPIGVCGFHTWNLGHNRAELFYYLYDDSSKRNGYVSEALPVVLNFGFKELNLNRIEALVAASNTPSVRLLQKNGFLREGVMREDYFVNGKHEDSDCYSLLRSEWVGDM